jgi:signal transduction histidine kinase
MAIGGGLAAAGLGVAVPVLWVVSRRRGASLAELLDRAPTTWRDVARIVSAIRHEVLKHHTTLLPAVADALDDGDPEPATWTSERLFAAGGPLDRFDGYVAELEQLGRRVGVSLDLRRKDPTFAPLLRAMGRLRGLRRTLARGGRRAAGELRDISACLHDITYPALGVLIRRMCVLSLDEALLRRVWQAVADEPAFRGASLPALELEGDLDGLHLRIWKDELVDILVNVVRNAVQASVDGGHPRVGIAVGTEEDPVTYLERVVVRVRDDAARRISTAMIRSRYIEGGLGLTVDLISRNGGSIHVEDEPGWSKAVVVRLPRVEDGEVP